MKAKLFKYLGISCALVMLSNTASLADSASGKIRLYHLNSLIAQRGVCIQMNPTVPATNGWLCLWKDNSLHKEITDLLLEAFLAQKTCSVNWSTYRGGLAAIDYISCEN